MKKTLFLLFLLCILSVGLTASTGRVTALSPVAGSISEGDTLDLGVIGPGQKVEIIADADTGAPSALKAGANADWDRFEVLTESLPIGWSKKDGLIYERKFSAFVTAAQSAPDGTYYFSVRAFDEYEAVAPLVFRIKVTISRNVLDISASPAQVRTGVGVPAVYKIRLKNKSQASDVFLLTVSGLPAAWEQAQKVYVPYGASTDVLFEAGASEQGEYSLEFKGTSLSSSEISDTAKSSMVAEANLFQDIKAASNGVMLFPSAQQAVVSALGFLANILG